MFGPGARRLVPRFVRNFETRRVLVVSDAGVMAAGWTGEVLDDLSAAGIETVLFTDVTANPRADQIMAGAEVYRAEECEALVSVGGGSVIDCAKGIGIVAANHRHVLEFEGVDQVDVAMPPLICVPTTTTAADVSQFAIISNVATGDKLAIISKAVMADVSLLDPGVFTTLPPDTTGLGAMDSLSQAIEAYVSNAHSQFTDLLALDAIRLVYASLPLVMAEPTNVEARSDLMFGTLQGGIAFSNASLGLIHATAHAVGGVTDAGHGACVAAMMRAVIEFNFPDVPERYAEVAHAMGVPVTGRLDEDVLPALLAALDRSRRTAHAAVTLGDLGVRRDSIPDLVRRTLRDPTLLTNPRPADAAEIEGLYERSL